MLVCLENVLATPALQVAYDLLERETFVDGKSSAGEQARRGKNNQELSGGIPSAKAINNLVMGALVRHPVYLHAGLPKRIAVPFYCRYKKGMGYGSHIDDPIMGQGEKYRADIAITIFLNGPEDYEGGELEIETSFGTRKIKANAGDGIMYPASSRHQVCEVTRGERLVAVTWMQSLVPESDRRELLFQLYQAKEVLRNSDSQTSATQQVEQSHANLVRMWSQL
ncbi:MAG: Fe2+-dependent dioxygenase [Gammaproteobacteria bacterium]|nr:Fe2+-dependent dioxygenase [Gammaproteobacteria bacterium]